MSYVFRALPLLTCPGLSAPPRLSLFSLSSSFSLSFPYALEASWVRQPSFFGATFGNTPCFPRAFPHLPRNRPQTLLNGISGLVVEDIVAIDATWVRFPADALRTLPSAELQAESHEEDPTASVV